MDGLLGMSEEKDTGILAAKRRCLKASHHAGQPCPGLSRVRYVRWSPIPVLAAT